MIMRGLLLGPLAVAALVACTEGGGDTATDDTPLVTHFQQDPVIPENGTAPQKFVDRERLPSCGSYAWTLDDQGPPEGLWTCLVESRKRGRPAELIVQAPGTDTVTVSYYRSRRNDEAVEVWVRDTNGDRWSRTDCEALDEESGPTSCEAVERLGR